MSTTEIPQGMPEWNPETSERVQIARLRRNLLALEEKVSKLEKWISNVGSAQQQSSAQLQGQVSKILEELNGITRRMDAERRLDVRTFWLVALGILMAGVPQGLATWAWSGIATLVVAAGFTAWILSLMIRDRLSPPPAPLRPAG